MHTRQQTLPLPNSQSEAARYHTGKMKTEDKAAMQRSQQSALDPYGA